MVFMKAVLNLQHNIASEGLERILSWEGGTVIFLHVYTCIIIYNIVAIIFWWGGGGFPGLAPSLLCRFMVPLRIQTY